ncbi:MoaD family protein [Eubacterium sp. 1001713B170207_170306_E7]|uniref:MoaD/ThiS family protein n=1 Tax=Eubacterium sp. 1001713B170207_170306_E7 TaxID=2787097 RepID=UPI001896B905|nr:MoaD family protein [Eubacterium sp. 1001713B170207_170306_E7]
MITVKYFGALRASTGTAQESIEAKNVKAVLTKIKAAHGKEAAAKARRCLILLNGDNVNLHRGMRTALGAGDVVSFVPVCAGG